jgi:DNA modification methylase
LPAGPLAELAFFDSQYNEGFDFGDGPKADRLPDAVFLGGLRERFEKAAQRLTPDGSLWALMSVKYSADLVLMLRDLGLHQRAVITWHETFGVNCTQNFNRCSRHLLYFVKDPKRFIFHPEAVRRVSARLRMGDARADPWGKLWDDVWGVDPIIRRLVDNDPKRVAGFPTQLPLDLLRPIVACATNRGGLVIDPMCGSATTGVACLELGNRFIGIERNPEFAALAEQRLRAAARLLDEKTWSEDERRRRDEALAGRAVVANLKSKGDYRLVCWARREGLLAEVDRASAWGNPFVLGRDGTRDQCCDHYETYLKLKPSLRRRVPEELRGKVLGCWCHPQRCHAHHLAALANGTGGG